MKTIRLKKHDMFFGRKIVIATMHKKEMVIGPILKKELGVDIVVPHYFDTDYFGTFTREIERRGSQLETAKAKAYAAMQATGLDLAVASEGSFDAHPSIPFIQSNLELVLLVDSKNNLAIRGHHRTSKTNINGAYVESVEEVIALAREWKFPYYGVILRKSEHEKEGIYKNLQTEKDLKIAAANLLASNSQKKIFIETDMRAHRNPTRMQAIKHATMNLIKNIKSTCKECKMPGFVVTDLQKGLKCSWCLMPTDLPIYEIYTCAKCGFLLKKPTAKHGELADPKYCNLCNP